MIGRVRPQQILDEDVERATCRPPARTSELPIDARLPDDQGRRRIDRALVEQQVASPRSSGSRCADGSMPRSANRHASAEMPGSIRASNPSARARRIAVVRRAHEDARMPVEREADRPCRGERPREPRRRSPHTISARSRPGLVVVDEGTRIRVDALDPFGGDGIGEEVEHLVRDLEIRARVLRDVPGNLDADPDDRERAALRRHLAISSAGAAVGGRTSLRRAPSPTCTRREPRRGSSRDCR